MNIRDPLARVLLVCLAAPLAPAVCNGEPPFQAQPAAATPAPPNDLDALMARALQRRAQTWARLHDYVLAERERFALRGPGGVRLHGLDREFAWYVRDGYFVRSPVKANGVTLGEAERTKYERDWLAAEKRRQERRLARDAKTGGGEVSQGGSQDVDGPGGDEEPGPAVGPESMVGRGEPRFVSEAYFLKFRFEPGNYYSAGREQLDGREVVKVEYYPTRLFSDRTKPGERERMRERRGARAASRSEEDVERDVERQFDKTSLVTLWVDPAESQIVKYTFDNVGMGFLPGRWLVRVTDVRASMTMGRYFDGVWLPREITMDGALALASGDYSAEYRRSFTDYRRAETSAVIRGYAPQEN